MSDDILKRIRDYDRHCSDADIDEAAAEIARLRLRVAELENAIRSLAAQDATLSVQGGNVTVEMDATLTDAERVAISDALCDAEQDAELFEYGEDVARAAVLRGLLERTK